MEITSFKKYQLNENDILYFSHIPKTAGTTLINILDKYFPENKVLLDHDWQSLLPNMPIDFSKYQFVRGHFGYSIIKMLPKKSISITMLREPIATLISSYKMSQRQLGESKRYDISSEWGFSELISKRPMLKNRQSLYLVADMDVLSMTKGLSKEQLKNYFPEHQKEFYLRELSDEKLLDLAKQRLFEFAFAGIVEKMEESLFLLHYIFGWAPIRNEIRENTAPVKNTDISKEDYNQLEHITKIDRKLYEYACELFETRYSKMVNELKEKYYEPKFDKMEANDAVFEMLKLDCKQRLEKNDE